MNNGFSLIEVLVSILVLAVGVIGTAGMQLASMRTAQQAALHAHALHLAANMADAMRVIQERLPPGADLFAGIDYNTTSAPARPARLCYADDCTMQELAEFEIHGWQAQMKALLPQGRMVVCRDSTVPESGKDMLWACDAGAGGKAPLVIKLGWQAKNPDGSLIRNADKAFPPGVALTVGI